jgi:hypothetical protein
MQVGINLFGALGMLGVGALAAWYRTKGRPKAPRPAQSVGTTQSLGPALLPVIAQPDTG